ncbi:hypothetical protein RintRC_5198 [Richelia intracellularis]|nr:hypothetical protein RintRC_5198 [Richelia intracellularis]
MRPVFSSMYAITLAIVVIFFQDTLSFVFALVFLGLHKCGMN